jgi:hypothetical protein
MNFDIILQICKVPQDIHPLAASAIESYLTRGPAFVDVPRALTKLEYYFGLVAPKLLTDNVAECLINLTSWGV